LEKKVLCHFITTMKALLNSPFTMNYYYLFEYTVITINWNFLNINYAYKKQTSYYYNTNLYCDCDMDYVIKFWQQLYFFKCPKFSKNIFLQKLNFVKEIKKF